MKWLVRTIWTRWSNTPGFLPYICWLVTHCLQSSAQFLEIPTSLILGCRFSISGSRRATSARSVGNEAPGWENRTDYTKTERIRNCREKRTEGLTHDSPVHLWNRIGPADVCASKFGATLPRAGLRTRSAILLGRQRGKVQGQSKVQFRIYEIGIVKIKNSSLAYHWYLKTIPLDRHRA